MERLCNLAMGIPLLGHAYRTVHTTLYHGPHIVEHCHMQPCDVHQAYRSDARFLNVHVKWVCQQ